MNISVLLYIILMCACKIHSICCFKQSAMEVPCFRLIWLMVYPKAGGFWSQGAQYSRPSSLRRLFGDNLAEISCDRYQSKSKIYCL